MFNIFSLLSHILSHSHSFCVFSNQRDIGEVISGQLARSERHKQRITTILQQNGGVINGNYCDIRLMSQ